MYTLNYAFTTSPDLTVVVKLLNNAGSITQILTPVASFTIGSEYALTLHIPTQYQGYVGFYDDSDNILALFSINPQEAENNDVPTSSNTTLGPGGSTKEITVLDNVGNPINGVAVWVTTDVEGQITVAGTLYSEINGHVIFLLPSGSYYLWRMSKAYTFDNPELFSVP